MTKLESRQEDPRPRTFQFRQKRRLCSLVGVGSFATSFGAKTVQCESEFGGDMVSTVSTFDSNIVSVEQSIQQVRQYSPNLRWRIKHPFNFDLCRIEIVSLANSAYQFGFNRNPSAPLTYTKLIHQTMDETLRRVSRDRRGLLHVPVQLVPISTGGAHCLVPQQILNFKLAHISSAQFRVGLIAVPQSNDIASVQNFKTSFPLAINQHGFFDCFVIWSNDLWNGSRTIHQQDLLVARTILGAIHAFRHDVSAPSIGDLLATLRIVSNTLGVSACEYPLQLKRRFANPFRKFADSNQVIEAIVNGVNRVINDPDTMLIEAKPYPSPQYIIVTGRFTMGDFWSALDQLMPPSTTKVLAAPSSADTITVGRLFPIDRCIKSVEKFWGLKRNRARTRSNRYTLPSDIVHESLRKTRPIIRKVAEYLHVPPEQLLYPREVDVSFEEERSKPESEEGTVSVVQQVRRR